ncbi:MAG: hypothetical protein AAGO57_00670 [Pseudomonadota bacterium]
MLRIALVAAGVLMLGISVALSQDADRDARLAVAKEYVEATLQDLDMSRMIEQMYVPLVDQVRASGRTVTDEQLAKLKALYEAEMMGPMEEIMLAQDEIMADLMTMEEITAIRDFYFTPEGRSVMGKLPDLLAVQQPMILELVGQKIPQMMPEIREILE